MKISVDPIISTFINNTNQINQTLETESKYDAIDLLCEGPIEGFVDSNGNSVDYINVKTKSNVLGKAIYYNDIPLVDKKTNLYNFSQSSFAVSFGNQFKNNVLFSRAIYTYKTKIYDFSKGSYKVAGLNDVKVDSTGTVLSNIATIFFEDDTKDTKFQSYIKAKDYAFTVNHVVQNKYSDSFDINISLDQLFSVNSEGTSATSAIFIINVENKSSNKNYYLFCSCNLVAKGGAIMVPFKVELDSSDKQNINFPEIVINIYSLLPKPPSGGETQIERSISLDSVIENISYPFSFPYSALVYNSVSSRHFNNIPVRSYDCKLLKIKVPENYDGEVREYTNNWSGNFNKNLIWTNNPAWVFYDLCSNSRYGLGKGQINEIDLNKWQFLTLSKFCDELVKTYSNSKYNSDVFSFDNSLSIQDLNYNSISFTVASTETLEKLQERYPFGSIVYLYDLKNKLDEDIKYNYKKIICSVSKPTSTTVVLKLCNDFGPKKILEQDLKGILFTELIKYLKSNPTENVEDKIKIFILKFFLGITGLNLSFKSQDVDVSVSHMSKKIFDTSLNVNKGSCVAKHVGYNEYLEPRFSCNVLINNENEGLKTLTDLASIFRGIFYFKNGLLNLTSDVKQNPVYIFTNSNVKDGLFTYASGDLNNSFSIAKVPYLDKNDNFKDKIIYVEDSDLIRKFGVVEKEILSFGITSKSEAQRIGKWYLSTGKLESEIVGFSTGIEATQLQIGNVVRISDNLKNASMVFGKITELDFKNNYIYIDREVSENCLGKSVKIYSSVDNVVSEFNFSVLEVDNHNLRLKIVSHAYMSWFIIKSIVVEDDGLKLTGGGTGVIFDKKAYTNNSFVDDCQISFSVVSPTLHVSVVGLSTINNTKVDQSDINYGFQITGGGTAVLSILQNNTPQSLIVADNSVKETDVLKIIYDGEYVRYYRNQTLVYGPVNVFATTKGKPLHGVVAMTYSYTVIKNILFSKYPDLTYGKYSNLRSGVNFAIYINEEDSQNDLYKIISINEVSSNEYSFSAMKYEEEKFNIIENNSYVKQNQSKEKQIVFSNDKVINEIFSDSELVTNFKVFPANYEAAVSIDYDYTFYIEKQTLNDDFQNNQFEYAQINFIQLFNILQDRGAKDVFGIMCIINRNGKKLSFNVLKSTANFITVFLGEIQVGGQTFKTSVDFYAFDSNYKIFNV
jgi:hypothetical protein